MTSFKFYVMTASRLVKYDILRQSGISSLSGILFVCGRSLKSINRNVSFSYDLFQTKYLVETGPKAALIFSEFLFDRDTVGSKDKAG